MKSPIKRRVAIAAALLLAPTVAACGFGAQTDKVYQPAAGVNDRAGVVEILNAQIVSATDGTGTFIAALDNNATKADKLINITGTGVTSTSEGVDIPADGVANLALPAAKGNPVQVQIDGAAVQAGKWVRLTFTFASGQSSQVLVPIVSNSEDYANVPLPSGAPSSAAAE
ncbi:hypothetical protein [Nocardioides marmorisolisilvae]|uniref:Copper chaperone PCu(A)C n=1 Tax=Nocardioides marmorisolisilvae TaxID=1542737 RepID=A0A3N0DP81_9ACTN|nr:hypothetical protein [Nocardioides marmorisolisilvae]RNL77460.1 hypothetical protein EFL95_15640 [Nocardioides marmorisolisilvae]